MAINFMLRRRRGGRSFGGGSAPPAPAPFEFEVATLTQSGTAISAPPPALRFSTDGNVNYGLPGFGVAASLVVSVEPDGKRLRVSGFANAAQRDAVLIHLRNMPSASAPAGDFMNGLYARNTELPAPRVADAGPRPAGLPIRTTRYNTPIGVTS